MMVSLRLRCKPINLILTHFNVLTSAAEIADLDKLHDIVPTVVEDRNMYVMVTENSKHGHKK